MDIEIEKINRQEVLKYLSYRGSQIPVEIDNLIDECIEEVIKTSNPKYNYQIFDIDRRENKIFLNNSDFELEGEDIKNLLKDSDRCILLAATLGIKIDQMIRSLQIRDMAKSIVVDSCASSAIESICNQINEKLEYDIEKEGKFITDRFSPGYGDLAIEVQKDFIELIDARRITGINVSSSGIMIPRKSVTAIIGISQKRQKKRFRGCENCNLFMDCEYRKSGNTCKESF
ncbi:MAG: hypothetical protein RR561_07565 [Peptostreptococcus sp.]|uniref:hypothetical protein n=1 Tax=Peptostreptococcus sp. TaxID=1262 RepID=UPI002FCC8998